MTNSTFISQDIEFRGSKEFRPVFNDHGFFIYDDFVFDIKEFKNEGYIRVDLDDCNIEPVCHEDHFYGMMSYGHGGLSDRELNELYGVTFNDNDDDEITVHNAVLVANIKGLTNG